MRAHVLVQHYTTAAALFDARRWFLIAGQSILERED